MSKIILLSWQALFSQLIQSGESFEMYFLIVGIGLLSDPNIKKTHGTNGSSFPTKSHFYSYSTNRINIILLLLINLISFVY